MINYAIVGGGRLARHFSEYFRLLEIPHTRWTRDRRSTFNTSELDDPKQRLQAVVRDADRVLLLVADNSLVAVLKQYPFLHDKQLIHCSGSLSIPGVAGAHPLMTFSTQLYPLDTYRRVPFVMEAGSSFAQLFPRLPNRHFVIGAEDRNRYHAMCVMAGNFPQLLWKGISDRFEEDLNLPATVLQPYLRQVAENFIRAPQTALTGPLSRNDRQTIKRNFNSLADDPLQDLYAAFVHFHEQAAVSAPDQQQAPREQVI